MDTKSFYKRQISLSEWFEEMDYKSKTEFREEDNWKRDRLAYLKKVIGIPFDEPVKFKAIDLSNKNPKFNRYLNRHSEEYCALRLIPKNSKLPKLRMRGLIIRKAYEWFKDQEIDPKKYQAEFIPHSEKPIWSTIFIVNNNGVFGEIIFGMLNQLSQGFYGKNKPILFSYDFNQLNLSEPESDAEEEIRKILNYIFVKDPKKKKLIKNKFDVNFYKNYLEGYFETISTEEYGLWFVDFNRILGRLYKDISLDLKKLKLSHSKSSVLVRGRPASSGISKGKARIIENDEVYKVKVNKGEVLVCEMTTPDHITQIKKASAIITDKGGVLCHAAIVAREFGIPCIVGTNNATSQLKDGDLIEVNANKGEVRLIKRVGEG